MATKLSYFKYACLQIFDITCMGRDTKADLEPLDGPSKRPVVSARIKSICGVTLHFSYCSPVRGHFHVVCMQFYPSHLSGIAVVCPCHMDGQWGVTRYPASFYLHRFPATMRAVNVTPYTFGHAHLSFRTF